MKMQLSVPNIWSILLLNLLWSNALTLLLTLYSIVVPWRTSTVSTIPQLTWMKMRLLLKNILCMYVTCVGKSGCIVAHRCRAILLRHFSCSWLAVACCVRYWPYMGCWPAMWHMHVHGTGAVWLYIQLAPWRYNTDHIRSWSLGYLQTQTLQLVSGVRRILLNLIHTITL